MNAHLMNYQIGGIHFYIVVLSEADNMLELVLQNEPLPGFLVNSLEQAFAIAELHNAPLLKDGNELLQGGFGL